MTWSLWWIWMLGAIGLATLEVLMPAQIFLGFALGAAGVGVALFLGIPGISTSLPFALVAFGVLSLIGWIAIRRVVGVRKGQVKVWDTDINDN